MTRERRDRSRIFMTREKYSSLGDTRNNSGIRLQNVGIGHKYNFNFRTYDPKKRRLDFVEFADL